MIYKITYNRCYTSGTLQNFVCKVVTKFSKLKDAKDYIRYLKKYEKKSVIPNDKNASGYTCHFITMIKETK